MRNKHIPIGDGNAFRRDLVGVKRPRLVEKIRIVPPEEIPVVLRQFLVNLGRKIRRIGLPRLLALFLLRIAFSSFCRVLSKNSRR